MNIPSSHIDTKLNWKGSIFSLWWELLEFTLLHRAVLIVFIMLYITSLAYPIFGSLYLFTAFISFPWLLPFASGNHKPLISFSIVCLYFFFSLLFFRAPPKAYGSFQLGVELELYLLVYARHSHSNAGSELSLQPTSQLMAMPTDLRSTEQGWGSNPSPHGYSLVGFVFAVPQWELLVCILFCFVLSFCLS